METKSSEVTLQDHKSQRAGQLFIALGRLACWIMEEVVWNLVMHLSRDTRDLQVQSQPWQWSISECGLSWSMVGLALHTHLPMRLSNPGTRCLLEMPVPRKGHASWTLKQGYIWIQCRTRLNLCLDANDIRRCKESSLFFTDTYCFFICCSIIEQTLSKQNLVDLNLKQFQILFPCFRHLAISMGLQPHFPFFSFFGKYFHSRVAVGRTQAPSTKSRTDHGEDSPPGVTKSKTEQKHQLLSSAKQKQWKTRSRVVFCIFCFPVLLESLFVIIIL